MIYLILGMLLAQQSHRMDHWKSWIIMGHQGSLLPQTKQTINGRLNPICLFCLKKERIAQLCVFFNNFTSLFQFFLQLFFFFFPPHFFLLLFLDRPFFFLFFFFLDDDMLTRRFRLFHFFFFNTVLTCLFAFVLQHLCSKNFLFIYIKCL